MFSFNYILQIRYKDCVRRNLFNFTSITKDSINFALAAAALKVLCKIAAVNKKELLITFYMNLLRLASLLPGYEIFISLGNTFFLACVRKYNSFINLFASYKVKTSHILHFCCNHKTRLFHS